MSQKQSQEQPAQEAHNVYANQGQTQGPKDAPDEPAHMPSINEPPGSDVLPDVPAPEANPAKPWANDEEEPPPEAAQLDDPDDMEEALEEAEDDDELVIHRSTKTTVHRGTPSKTLPKHRKK